MEQWIIWLMAGALLVLIEVLTQAVWALCFAIGCVAAVAVSLITESAAVQAITVPIVALVAWMLLAPIVRKWERRRALLSRTGMDALLGRKATVTEEIKPGSCGRARIDGDYWQVRAPGVDRVIRRGEEVTVIEYNSIILNVSPD